MKVKKWLLAIATFAVMAVVCAVAAGAENTHTAYIKYADNDWEPSIMDYSGRNELGTTWKSTTCDVSDDGTYTVSISNIKNTYVDEETGDERTEAIGGEGAVVLCVEIENLSDDFNMGRFSDTQTLYEKLDEFGKMPLPPYITRQLEDQSQYQTVYAKELGSAAAPTAGLHFTPELLDTIRAKGVNIVEVTLHVGLGTFRPVSEDNIQEHQMHTEWYCVNDTAAEAINAARASGHRVIAVGTTSCRTLEAVWAKYGKVVPCSGTTDIFLYPGVELHAIDGLVTNFHLPESTLIMLISAFYGYEKTMAAYKVAVQEKYRFFSFGDAMFIQ